jgi:hypothetical protein
MISSVHNLLCTYLLGADLFQILLLKFSLLNLIKYTVKCSPWLEGQGGDLDGEHSDLLTHALTTLVGKQHDKAFGCNTMDTQWKQFKLITLSSAKTLEYFTTRLEDIRDSEITLSQTLGTNLESVMLKAGYDEDLVREWVPMFNLYRISLLGFQYFVGLHTHLWKVSTTYS